MKRKLLIALLIALISTYSYNSERLPDLKLAESYFKKGIDSLRKLNYTDALTFFSKAYSIDPKSYYGELSYLYLGKSYALYSYAYGSRKGVLAAVGYLNQYPFHYKVPKFIHTQREFIADSYLLIQWYDTAKNIYANLYGETEKKEYMIKYGYAASLSGSIEGYNYLKKLTHKGVPADYLDLYYMTMGFYNFNLGRYPLAVEYMTSAINVNTHLREDANLLFRMGVSYYKLSKWRKAIVYLELTLRNDPMKVHSDSANFYLANINLETKNYRDAFANLKSLTEEDKLFYNKLAQILFSSLWYHEEFLELYQKELGDYRSKLLQLGWLNVEDSYGELPAIGIYYLALKSKSLTEEEREFLRVKRIKLREFVLGYDLFVFDKYILKAREGMKDYKFYEEDQAKFLTDLYSVNRNNFLTLFSDQRSLTLLARSKVFLGDDTALEIIPFIKDEGVRSLLTAKLDMLKGRENRALNLLKNALGKLSGEDEKEAQLLVAYMENKAQDLERLLKEIDFSHPRFAGYKIPALVKLADLLYQEGDLPSALNYYKMVVKEDKGNTSYWWSLFRIAMIGERLEDEKTLKWVVKRAKEEDNIWSRAIRTLWEG